MPPVSGWRQQRGLGKSLRRGATLTIELAEAWFRRITDVASLVPLFEEAERQPFERFGFDNYTQHRLAYSFVLARTGDLTQARIQIDRGCQTHVFGRFGSIEERRQPLAERPHQLLDAAAT
jgi:hypothetical protein